MNENEQARFYDERRGDVSLWAAKPSKANVRRGGTVVFSLRFDRQELAFLRDKADAEGTTVSDLIRRAAMKEALGETLPIVEIVGPIPGGGESTFTLDLDTVTSPMTSRRSGPVTVSATTAVLV